MKSRMSSKVAHVMSSVGSAVRCRPCCDPSSNSNKTLQKRHIKTIWMCLVATKCSYWCDSLTVLLYLLVYHRMWTRQCSNNMQLTRKVNWLIIQIIGPHLPWSTSYIHTWSKDILKPRQLCWPSLIHPWASPGHHTGPQGSSGNTTQPTHGRHEACLLKTPADSWLGSILLPYPRM